MAPVAAPLALLDVCMVTTTVATEDESRRLAQAVLYARLAACVQVEPITSHFRWQGAVQEDREMRLACKTTGAAVPALIGLLRAQHPYALPQLVVQVLQASVEYAQWVHSEVVVPACAVQT
ncbi:MAG: divalent-cation tolerance protein CutA [Acidovorax sp.]|nr:divalent-cation tolerance protein CutA [Acidovorax sp.]